MKPILPSLMKYVIKQLWNIIKHVWIEKNMPRKMICAVNCDSIDRSNTITFWIDNQHSIQRTCVPPKLFHLQQNHREQIIWCANMIKITTKQYTQMWQRIFSTVAHIQVSNERLKHIKNIFALAKNVWCAKGERERLYCHLSLFTIIRYFLLSFFHFFFF